METTLSNGTNKDKAVRASSIIKVGVQEEKPFRHVTHVPLPTQFSSIPNPNFHDPNVQPPGVKLVSIMLPGMASRAGSIIICFWNLFGAVGKLLTVGVEEKEEKVSLGFLTLEETEESVMSITMDQTSSYSKSSFLNDLPPLPALKTSEEN
ncbi:hypothetical protein NE237_003478 [Protea cynaroides]|uniref:Uncharacterized protein n=1 Tax=Protea cynaroides TaxID=273540 RepID=A0A9Q0QSS2_9MAGN|nr:hypothetical protein NE237_003478 [Protea cynaroides]